MLNVVFGVMASPALLTIEVEDILAALAFLSTRSLSNLLSDDACKWSWLRQKLDKSPVTLPICGVLKQDSSRPFHLQLWPRLGGALTVQ